eukprot:c18538_g2_i1 orf=3-242(-)
MEWSEHCCFYEFLMHSFRGVGIFGCALCSASLQIESDRTDDLLLVKDGAETQRINTETSEDGVAIQIQTTRRFPDLLQSG